MKPRYTIVVPLARTIFLLSALALASCVSSGNNAPPPAEDITMG